MVDQLSLDLRVGPPRLPATIRPMLPQPAAEPFDSPEHLFEPSWGGIRLLAFVEAPRLNDAHSSGALHPDLRLIDEQGRDVTALLPELASLPEHVENRPVVLDGEIVVVDRLGRSDALALAARMRGSRGPSVAYLAFDLLYRDGRPLFAVPLERRREQLRRVLRPGDAAIAVPSIAGDGRALYDAVVEAGLAGVMGRGRRSPYLPGVRSRLWQFAARGVVVGRTDHDAVPTLGEPESQPVDPLDGNAPMLALIRRLPLDDAEA